MASLSLTSPLDQWDLAPGEPISQSPPNRATKRSNNFLCPRPTLDTEQFNIDGESALNDSLSLNSLDEFDFAPGEDFSQSPPRGIRRCPTPPCPPPTFDTQEFMNDHSELEDAWQASDSAERLEDVPDSLDSAPSESTKDRASSAAILNSGVDSTSPGLSAAKRRILLKSSPPHSPGDPPALDKVDIHVTFHERLDPVTPNLSWNEETRNSQVKEISSLESSDVNRHPHLARISPGRPSESSAFPQPRPLSALSPSKGCGNKDWPIKRKRDEKSPHKHGSGHRPVLVPLSPSLCLNSPVFRNANSCVETSSGKENALDTEGKLNRGSTRPVVCKQEPLLNFNNVNELVDITKGSPLNESRGHESNVKVQVPLDAYSSVERNAGRRCDLSCKASEWRNPRSGKKVGNAGKQVTLDRWLG